MNDLISRSDVLDLLYGIFDKYKMSTDKNTSIGKSFGTDVFEEIRNMPTAYDIDKVVAELEERTDFLKDCTKYGNKNAKQQAESYSTMMMYEVADLVDDLIEIVKQGGVSDDVCEWKKGSSGYVGYNAYYSKCCTTKSKGLEAQKHVIKDWKYCPYCGKKIKVVE